MIKRLLNKIKNKIFNPKPDILGAAVIGATVGRLALYSAFSISFWAVGMHLYSLIFFSVLLMEATLQISVLRFLQLRTIQER